MRTGIASFFFCKVLFMKHPNVHSDVKRGIRWWLTTHHRHYHSQMLQKACNYKSDEDQIFLILCALWYLAMGLDGQVFLVRCYRRRTILKANNPLHDFIIINMFIVRCYRKWAIIKETRIAREGSREEPVDPRETSLENNLDYSFW